MGYMLATGGCVNCQAMFTFNPDLVPSVVVNGSREPICRPCVEWANPQREKAGLQTINILPGAYEPQEVA